MVDGQHRFPAQFVQGEDVYGLRFSSSAALAICPRSTLDNWPGSVGGHMSAYNGGTRSNPS